MVTIGTKILKNRLSGPGKQVKVHQIVFIDGNIPVHVFLQAVKQLPAEQLGTQAGLNQSAVQQVPLPGQMILPAHHPGIVDIADSSVRKPHPMAAVGNFRLTVSGIVHEPPVHIRVNFIVSVHKADPCPGGLRHPSQPGGGGASVLLTDQPNVVKAGRIVLGHRPGIIPGTIVHHHNLQIGVSLGQQAVQTPGQPLGNIVSRHNHRNPRQVHSGTPFLIKLIFRTPSHIPEP